MSDRTRESNEYNKSAHYNARNAKMKLKEIFNGTIGTKFNLQNLKNSSSVGNKSFELKPLTEPPK